MLSSFDAASTIALSVISVKGKRSDIPEVVFFVYGILIPVYCYCNRYNSYNHNVTLLHIGSQEMKSMISGLVTE